MANLGQVVFFMLIGSIVSLTEGFFLLANKHAKKLTMLATPFAAGALLAAAFVNLLPQAVESDSAHTALLFSMIATVGFFIYIATNDTIPTLHETKDIKLARMQILMLIYTWSSIGECGDDSPSGIN